MENASKALLMAAGVLIALIILSIGVYLYSIFSNNAQEIASQLEEDRLNQFNSQFTSYIGKDDLTIYDIIDIANLAKANNEKYELDSISENNYYVSVTGKINGNNSLTNLEKGTEENKVEWITKDIQRMDANGNLPKYKCKNVLIREQTTKRVYKVEFESL